MPLFEPVFARIQSSSEAIRFSVAQIISRLPSSFVIRPADQTPEMSAFVIENGVIYHTYSTCGRRVDATWSMYPWLDRAPEGRSETVRGRRRDEYDSR